jgi:hypothetical protein
MIQTDHTPIPDDQVDSLAMIEEPKPTATIHTADEITRLARALDRYVSWRVRRRQ